MEGDDYKQESVLEMQFGEADPVPAHTLVQLSALHLPMYPHARSCGL